MGELPAESASGTVRPRRATCSLHVVYSVAPSGTLDEVEARTVLLWLLVVDGLLIAADLLCRLQVLADVRFLVSQERGFGELFMYAKAAAGVVMLTVLADRGASLALLLWALVFLLVLADDALALHERAGQYLASFADLPSFGALRDNQVGELAFFVWLGTCCAVLVGLAWHVGTPGDRRLSRVLLVCFGALGFCATALDAMASSMRRSRYGDAFVVLEDGGEMLVMSVVVATASAAFRRVVA